MTLKILITLDFNHQQPRSLIHILGVISDFSSSDIALGTESPRPIRNELTPIFPKEEECHAPREYPLNQDGIRIIEDHSRPHSHDDKQDKYH